jgi:hypothetical protein
MIPFPGATTVLRWVGVFLVIAVLGASPVAQGQVEVNPGIKAGVNFASFGGEDTEQFFQGADEQFRTGVILGGFVEVDPPGPFALQTELLYVQKGSKAEGTVSGETVTGIDKINYIEVPLLAKWQIPVTGPLTPNLFAGPAVGVPVSATSEIEGSGGSSSTDIDELIKPTDVGMHIGAGLDVATGTVEVMLDVRYQFGLSTILRGDNKSLRNMGIEEIKNRGVGITAGLSF